MYLSVNDGVVVHATHFIECNPEGARDNLAPFQLEKNGVVVYPNQNKDDVITILNKHKIPFTEYIQRLDPVFKVMSNEVKYASRSEAIEHLQNLVEPKYMIMPNLKKKLANEKTRNDLLESRLTLLEQKISKGGL